MNISNFQIEYLPATNVCFLFHIILNIHGINKYTMLNCPGNPVKNTECSKCIFLTTNPLIKLYNKIK